MALIIHMKVLRRKVALEIHRSKLYLQAYPAELINADSTGQRNRTIAGWKKVQWPGVLVFGKFPEGIMISEDARIRNLTLRVRQKQPRVGQIWSQIEKLVFLEIWDVPWRISMATIRRGTFTCCVMCIMITLMICKLQHVDAACELSMPQFQFQLKELYYITTVLYD